MIMDIFYCKPAWASTFPTHKPDGLSPTPAQLTAIANLLTMSYWNNMIFVQDYGDNVQVDGFDIDYGNEVLTLKLGSLGTYVLNKQTPNRQIWMSSPVSGPSRFDWDREAKEWIYRRTEAKLHKLLEEELENLCGKPIKLS